MNHTSKTIQELATTLLQGLCIHDPTAEQYKAAEGFIRKVVLPIEKNCMAKVGLTPREWLCLNLAAHGFSAGETAEQLSITIGTAMNYRTHIREKLECKSIAQAVYKAFVKDE
jgi:DNA-binding CsgD family transcriptional regulator